MLHEPLPPYHAALRPASLTLVPAGKRAWWGTMSWFLIAAGIALVCCQDQRFAPSCCFALVKYCSTCNRATSLLLRRSVKHLALGTAGTLVACCCGLHWWPHSSTGAHSALVQQIGHACSWCGCACACGFCFFRWKVTLDSRQCGGWWCRCRRGRGRRLILQLLHACRRPCDTIPMLPFACSPRSCNRLVIWF